VCVRVREGACVCVGGGGEVGWGGPQRRSFGDGCQWPVPPISSLFFTALSARPAGRLGPCPHAGLSPFLTSVCYMGRKVPSGVL
jgi:hypothetical protein